MESPALLDRISRQDEGQLRVIDAQCVCVTTVRNIHRGMTRRILVSIDQRVILSSLGANVGG